MSRSFNNFVRNELVKNEIRKKAMHGVCDIGFGFNFFWDKEQNFKGIAKRGYDRSHCEIIKIGGMIANSKKSLRLNRVIEWLVFKKYIKRIGESKKIDGFIRNMYEIYSVNDNSLFKIMNNYRGIVCIDDYTTDDLIENKARKFMKELYEKTNN